MDQDAHISEYQEFWGTSANLYLYVDPEEPKWALLYTEHVWMW